MKAEVNCLFLLLVTVLQGCQKCDYVINDPQQYVLVRFDPNSANTFVTALLPTVNQISEYNTRLRAQEAWLVRNFDKCLKKLEAERGLKPILPKYSRPFRSDPNSTFPVEPWYEPYESPLWYPMETPSGVKMLMCWLGIYSSDMHNRTFGINDRIENFEQRMKRLDEHLNK